MTPRRNTLQTSDVPRAADLLGPEDFVPTMAELERLAIKKAMRLSAGSISKAAIMLGIGRATLYRKLATMEQA